MLEPVSSESARSSAVGSSEWALAEVVDQIAARLQRGEQIDVEEYTAQYPQWAEPLRRLLPALEALAMARSGERVATQSIEGGSTPVGVVTEGESGRGGEGEKNDGRADSSQPVITPALSQWERAMGDGPLSPSLHPSVSPSHPRRLDDFELLREVGRGGMGIVYEARQVSLARRVAVKVLPQAGMLDPRQLQRFQNEARSAAQLNHPNIVDVICVGCAKGVHYFAMRFVDGKTLAEVIGETKGSGSYTQRVPGVQGSADHRSPHAPRDSSPHAERDAYGTASASPSLPRSSFPFPPPSVSLSQKAGWIAQAAEALEHAHALGIVHRDVKPSNLLVDRDGKLWVTDFGLARFGEDAGLTMTGDLLGTLRYMSPEQALGQRAAIDHRSDVYALGATLYELLALRPVFEGSDRGELLRRVAFAQPKPLRRLDRHIPRDLETITLKALEKTPGDRYVTAGEMSADLRRLLRGEPIHAKPPTVVQRSFKWCWRHRPVVAAAAAVLVLAVVGLSISTVLIARSRDEAVVAKKLFQDRDRENRRMLSAVETRLALEAYQRGELGRASELLECQVPSSGILENSGDGRTGENSTALTRREREKEEDFRDFTWHWLRGAIRERLPLVQSFDDYPSEIYEIDYSPDGTLLAAACKRKIILRDVESGMVCHEIAAHDSIVNTLDFSPDGALLASVGNDHRVRLWDVATGKLAADLGAHECEATAVGFSLDGSRLASGDNHGLIRIWDMADRREEKLLKGHLGKVDGAVFADSSTLIAISDIDHLMISWDVDTGQPLWKFQAPNTEHVTIVASPDGTTVAASDRMGTVGLWNVADGRALGAMGARTTAILGVALSPNGQLMAAGADDGITQLWDLTGQSFCGQTAKHRGRVRSAAFSPNGRILATGGDDRSVSLWDIATGRRPRKLMVKRDRVRFAFSSVGDLAIVADDTLWLWQRGSPAPVARGKLEPQPWPAHASLTWQNEQLLWTPADGEIAVLGFDGKSSTWATRSPTTGDSMRVSNDGKWLATYGQRIPGHKESTELWRISDNTLAYQHEGLPLMFTSDSKHAIFVQERTLSRLKLDDLVVETIGMSRDRRPDLALSWDDRLLAVTNSDATIDILDLATGDRRNFTGHERVARALDFSPDGRTLATGGLDGTVRLWRVDLGEPLGVLDRWTNGDVQQIAFSPDGRRLAAAGRDGTRGAVSLWEIEPPDDGGEE